MSYNLFLDDVRHPDDAYAYTGFRPFLEETWSLVRNYDEFVSMIKRRGLPKFIAFDHDLAPDHYQVPFEDWNSHSSEQLNMAETGMDCAQWLINYCMDNEETLPEFFVHSMNPAGRENIKMLLTNFKKFQKDNE